MTDITQNELNDIINAAKARQAGITPAPWGRSNLITQSIISMETGANVATVNWDEQVEIDNPADADLITAAPTLNAAVIALDTELTRVKSAWEAEATAKLDLTKELEAALARIEALERKLGYLEAHGIYNKP